MEIILKILSCLIFPNIVEVKFVIMQFWIDVKKVMQYVCLPDKILNNLVCLWEIDPVIVVGLYIPKWKSRWLPMLSNQPKVA